MNAPWQSDSARRLICAVALWGWGMTSSGLLLSGAVTYAQGVSREPHPAGTMLLGGLGLVAWVALSRLNGRPVPAASAIRSSRTH